MSLTELPLMPDLPTERMMAQARLVGSRSDLAFRCLLDTTSRPGLVGRFVDPLFVGIPAVLLPALTLANVDTTVAVIGDDASDDAAGWLTLLCRATDSQPANASAADIVTVVGRIDPALSSRLRPGTPENPELGARLVLACEALCAPEGSGPTNNLTRDGDVVLELRGPGVDGTCRLVVVGVPVEFFARLAAVNAEPSCGIDVHLVEPGGRTVALPRSTHITVLEGHVARSGLPTELASPN